jgi:hypothetical protein
MILSFLMFAASAADAAQSMKLREAIKEYEANKWKVIGQKVGKPAKVRIDGNPILRIQTDQLAGLRTICQRAFQERVTTMAPLMK